MLRYLARRVLQIAPLLVVILVINFTLIHLTPGDAVSALAGENASLEYQEELRKAYGLDRSLGEQFVIYVQTLLSGDLGFSYAYRQPVAELILSRIPATLLLVLSAEIPAILIGTWLGLVSVRHRGSWLDRIITWTSLSLYSVPVFWSGMLLILLFSVQLGWLPTSGMTSYGEGGGGFLDLMSHLLLPALALMLFNLPTYARLARASLSAVSEDDYVITARAIGYPQKVVYRRFVLRNALLPTITIAGLQLGMTFGGALLTETVFSWPGMGQLMYQAVFQRDYPVLMGVFLLTSICVAVVTLLTDLAYAAADPRIRVGRTAR